VHVVHPALGSDEIWTWTADNQAETPPNPPTPNQLGNRIKSIKNRTGGTTKVTYQPSSKPNVTNAYLPVGMIMHPVKTLETNNGLTPATIHTTTYGFEKGLWSSDERCFLGFEVSRRFHEAAGTAGSYEETTLDRTVANCINPASKVAQKKPAGTAGVYTDDQFFSFTDYVHEVDTTRPYQALEQERTVNECNLTSNLSNCRKVETETQYDQYANVTRVVERGDIGLTGDERTTVTAFAYNTSAFIVDRPSQETVYVGLKQY
jgi:hypothetical protein